MIGGGDFGGNVIADLLVRFRGDTRDLDRDMRHVDGALGKTQKRFGGFATAVGGALAGAAVTQFAWESIKAAGDLGESLNKNQVIFGQHAKRIEEWSTKSQYSIYLTQQAALDYASSMGNLFTGVGIAQTEAADMSMKLSERAVDLASLHNTTVEEAAAAMKSGLVGETEPLRKYGIMLSAARIEEEALAAGIAKRGQELTNEQKQLATYNLILRDSAVADKDAINTKDSMSNKLKQLSKSWDDLKITFGTEFLPIATEVVTHLVDVVKLIRPAIPTLIKLAGAVAAVGIAWKSWTVLRNVSRWARDLFDSWRGMPKRIPPTMTPTGGSPTGKPGMPTPVPTGKPKLPGGKTPTGAPVPTGSSEWYGPKSKPQGPITGATRNTPRVDLRAIAKRTLPQLLTGGAGFGALVTGGLMGLAAMTPDILAGKTARSSVAGSAAGGKGGGQSAAIEALRQRNKRALDDAMKIDGAGIFDKKGLVQAVPPAFTPAAKAARKTMTDGLAKLEVPKIGSKAAALAAAEVAREEAELYLKTHPVSMRFVLSQGTRDRGGAGPYVPGLSRVNGDNTTHKHVLVVGNKELEVMERAQSRVRARMGRR